MYQPNYSVNGFQNRVPQNYNQPNLQMQPGLFPGVQRTIKYRNAFMGLGFTQIIIGIICFILGIVSLFNGVSVIKYSGFGIWSGVLFFISGLLALLVGANKNARPSLIIATMVMNIISALAGADCLYLGILQVVTSYTYSYSNKGGYSYTWARDQYDEVVGSIMATLGVIEAILSIACSALCCNAYCCCTSPQNGVVILDHPANVSYPNNSGLVIIQPQQPYPPFTHQQQQLSQLRVITK